jgi:hypothetical protein
VGSGDGEISNTILQSLMEWEEKDLDSEWAIFYSVALGLIFMGRSLFPPAMFLWGYRADDQVPKITQKQRSKP